MKIKIEIDESAAEDEVIIRCRGLTKQVAAVQRAVRDVTNASEKILLYKGNTEYYVTLSRSCFSRQTRTGSAHTPGMRCIRPGTNYTSWKICFRAFL